MNSRLVVYLAGFGLAMGVATLFGIIPRGMEGLLWLAIAIFCAIWIPRQVAARHFAHGFLVGLIAGAISPLIQVLFFPVYLANNRYAAESFGKLPGNLSPRLFTLAFTPVIAILCGLILGSFAWLAGKVSRRGRAVTAKE